MATANIAYSAVGTVTITLASLAASATQGRESLAVDNSVTLYDDVLVGGTITTGTPVANTQIEVWIAASYDGTNYTGGATGADALLTPVQQSKTYMRLGAILSITAVTASIAHKFLCPSLVSLFGAMPLKWSVFVLNNSGGALNATAANHEIQYVGITYTSA